LSLAPTSNERRSSSNPMPFEFSPIKLVYGGEALGHYAGRTVLVPRVLPGERAEVEETRTAKGVVHARPLRILASAPERVEPPCPYFGRCGGCEYQHLDYERQTEAKREILRETLRRLGKVIWDSEIPVHAGPAWNYRNRAELKLGRKAGGKAEIGFFESESHRLLPIDSCPILSPRLNSILSELRGDPWSSRLAACREMELFADDRDEKVVVTLRGTFQSKEGEALADDLLARLQGVASVAIEGEEFHRVSGEPGIAYRVGEFEYHVSPGSFFQSSRFLLPELGTAVTGGESGLVALDLYAGVGLFSLPLARRFTQVLAVESDANSARDLAANARAAKNIRAVEQTVSEYLRRCGQSEPDLVVVDPPRSGVGIATLKMLLTLRPQRLNYVSCSPPTLARDLSFVLANGYELNSVEFFDFFPQTYHIESLARLTRKDLARE
jgi:23S rRNA (uracil1939-C5)-methyltransferase